LPNAVENDEVKFINRKAMKLDYTVTQ